MVGEDDDLELQAPSHEERCTTLIGFEFTRGLTNTIATFSTTDEVFGFPFGLHLDVDLFEGPYSGSASMVWGLPNSVILF
jgi:hypothetical protein